MKSKQIIANRNETLQGPSPKVQKAIRGFSTKEGARYFEGYHGSILAPILAGRFQISRERVSVGYGIEFFLREFFDALDAQKDVIVLASPHYGYYTQYPATRGIRLIEVPLVDRGDAFFMDAQAMVRVIKKIKPKMVLLASPNNPTGDVIRAKDVEAIAHAAGQNALVVLDEAYYGFDPEYDEKSFMQVLKHCPNLVLLRGFSKLYAMAGFRIGFALWGARAKKLARFEDLYLGGSRLLETAAIRALDSETYYHSLAKKIIREREAFFAATNRLTNFRAYASHANFIYVRVSDAAASALAKAMKQTPVLIARFVEPHGIRVSIGHPKDMKAFARTLVEIDRTLQKKQKGVTHI